MNYYNPPAAPPPPSKGYYLEKRPDGHWKIFAAYGGGRICLAVLDRRVSDTLAAAVMNSIENQNPLGLKTK